jgi:heat shock protein HtpX
MAGLLAGIGFLLAGWWGVLGSTVFLAVSVALTGRLSPALILRLYRAHPLEPWETPVLYRIAAELAERAELEAIPRLYYIPSRAPNAVSLGSPARPYIGVTDGALRRLGQRELVGIFAHEVSHIRNRDLWLMGFADGISRLTSLLSLVGTVILLGSAIVAIATGGRVPWIPGLLLLVAPLFSELLQLALSRARELDADLDAANLTGDPAGLASALAKLELASNRLWWRMWPVRRSPQPSLLRTHPDTKRRIERLLKLEEEKRYRVDRPQIAHVFEPPAEWVVLTRDPRRRWSGVWY